MEPEQPERTTDREKLINESDEAVTQAPTIDLSGLDPKVVKMAEKFGIPISKIIEWAQYQEARMNRIEEYLQKTLQTDMKTVFEQGLQATVKNVQNAQSTSPSVQGSGGANILSMLSQFAPMLSGGGGDSEIHDLTKQIMRESLVSMRHKADITDRFMDAVIGSISGKIGGKVVEKATENF